MSTTFEKTWQFGINYKTDATSQPNTNKNAWWWLKAFLCGQLAIRNLTAAASGDNVAHPEVATTTQDQFLQGLWTVYYSCDGSTAGTAGDGIDRWGSQGGTTLQLGGHAGSTNSGATASFTTGATIVGAVRMTGLANMAASDVGNFLTITGAATSANNSPSNTPFKIVQYNSATSVDIYNPGGSTTDANNGAISWTERAAFTTPASYTTIVQAPGSHSWIVLKSPAALGPYYIIIDLNNATTTTGNIAFAKTAPTGGTASARPTSTDEVNITSWQTQIIVQSATFPYYMHGLLTTDGMFTIFGSRGNIGLHEFCWIFQVPADTKSADLYKAVMFMKYASGGQGLTAPAAQTVTNWGARNFNGSIVLSGLTTLELYNGASIIMTDLSTLDYTDSLYDDLPVYIFNGTSGQYTLKGRLYDIRRAPGSGAAGIPDGFTEPNPSAPVSMVLGNFWFPTNLAILL